MTFTARGIVAAPFLPMLPDESIDWSSLRSYIAWIAAQQPTAIASASAQINRKTMCGTVMATVLSSAVRNS